MMQAMSDDEPSAPDRQKVRMGLAVISLVLLVAVVLMLMIDDRLGHAVMFAVALTAIIRAYLLTRSLRSDRRS